MRPIPLHYKDKLKDHFGELITEGVGTITDSDNCLEVERGQDLDDLGHEAHEEGSETCPTTTFPLLKKSEGKVPFWGEGKMVMIPESKPVCTYTRGLQGYQVVCVDEPIWRPVN